MKVKRKLKGYGEEFLVQIFRDIEEERRSDIDRIEKFEKERKDWSDSLEINMKQLRELEDIYKKIQDRSVKGHLQEEIYRLRIKGREVMQKIKHHTDAIDNLSFRQSDFNRLQNELVGLGILAQN